MSRTRSFATVVMMDGRIIVVGLVDASGDRPHAPPDSYDRWLSAIEPDPRDMLVYPPEPMLAKLRSHSSVPGFCQFSQMPASANGWLAGIHSRSAVIDGELVFPAADGRPDFYRLQSAMSPDRQHELAVFAFDLLHHNGEDLRSILLIDRRLQLTELVARSNVPCLRLVWGFDDGAKLLEAAERHGLESIVSRSARGQSTVRGHRAIGSAFALVHSGSELIRPSAEAEVLA
jgi:hypothetical protein